MEEIELIRKVREGDKEAFGALFERYKVQAIRTVYLITGDQYRSEDIVQEAFVKCYLSIHKLRNPEQFRAWFFRILTRLAWRNDVRAKRMVPTEDIMEVMNKKADQISLENIYLQSETQRLLQGEIEKLGSEHQMILILYYYNELSVKEIAKVVGCLEGTVKSRLHTARGQLKKALIARQESKVENGEGEGYEAYRGI
ncbi:RNA polymerase subunit sigma-24 [Sporanaerobium hydrogeniformans]|uniref:RNA polymerase subunit sigma-24 n=1 Tax=Sporanaerobium hydrogeniformans TaxID=3072179 RepID=A0AC61DD43_9FIRM|nr:RNA polymerase sigma factor [Sporanaerobium hydrogeniformans]PHV70472.1 RNA polymerase subunit sigma-24 [Sporanaerobium hydrogeniformans]